MKDILQSFVDEKMGSNVAVFKGKAEISAMKEKPTQLAHQTVKEILNVGREKNAAAQAGIQTWWMDQDNRWQIQIKRKTAIMGKIDWKSLTVQVFINTKCEEIAKKENQTRRLLNEKAESDRTGSLFQLLVDTVELKENVDWGRKPKT